jgi:hypothetical protein
MAKLKTMSDLHMPRENLPSIREILSGLRPPQLWGLGSSIVVLFIGSLGLGTFIEKTQSQNALLEKNMRIAELTNNSSSIVFSKDKEISKLGEEINDLKSVIQFVRDKLKDKESIYFRLETKSEFLNRYVSFMTAKDDFSKKLFSDYVCVMWKNSQERRLHIDQGRINISVDDLKRGISPNVQLLLQNYGIDPSLISQMNRLEKESDRPVPQPFIRNNPFISPQHSHIEDELDSRLQKVHITKTVTFFDGTKYEVPEEVAIDVHTRADCVPGRL